MPELSRARVLFAGLIAGLAIDSIQYLLDSFVFQDNWTAVAAFLNSLAAPRFPAVSIGLTLIMIFLQLVGFAAGIAAVRLYATAFESKRPSVRKPATLAWALTYGLVCLTLLVIGANTKEANKAPMGLWRGVAFASSGWLVCLAGTSLGGWIYREIAILARASGAEA